MLYSFCTKTFEDLFLHFSYIQEDPPATSAYTFYINDSSCLLNSNQFVGYAVISDAGILKAAFLTLHTTNLQAELVALTQAFQIIKNTNINAI